LDHAVKPAAAAIRGRFRVPPSKEHQRALLLSHLSDGPTVIDTTDLGPPGDDVCRLAAALGRLGRHDGSFLGRTRESLRLDLGEGATGLRFLLAAATLRPPGARTLLTGRPGLRRRSHHTLLAALSHLGAHVRRRRSGALRVLGGGIEGGALEVDASRSSHPASGLLLTAPRLRGGLSLRLRGPVVSRPYLELTLEALRRFGVRVETSEGDDGDLHVRVPEGAPRGTTWRLAADASAAAAWWTGAALTGGTAEVAGFGPVPRQADEALLGWLERAGARTTRDAGGVVRVEGPPGGALRPLGEVDLAQCPDLVFLLGVLAARAEGTTRLVGVSRTRAKESDRALVLLEGLLRMGARARFETEDAIRIEGGPLAGTRVATCGDHRAAFAFGVLGLVVPGVVLAGAEGVAKSHPGFLADLAHAAARAGGL
jgi:3-phosphoshikimate 1-carboxyvinyltransferase